MVRLRSPVQIRSGALTVKSICKIKMVDVLPLFRRSRKKIDYIMTIERLKRAVSILSCYGKIPVMDRDYSKNQA